MNQIKAGAVLSYISLGLSNILGIIYTPFMLRMMGQSEYGLFSLVFSVVTALNLLDCGFGPAIVRFTTKLKNEDKDKLPAMYGMFIILYSILGLISFILCSILAENINMIFSDAMTVEEIHKAKIMIWIIGIYVSVGFPLSVFNSIIIAHEKFIFLKSINILRTLLFPALMIPLLLLGYKSIAMASVLVAVGILVWIINVCFCIFKIKISIKFEKINFKILKEILSFSVFIFIKMILDRLYWSSGQFILGAISGTIAVAIFSIALQMKGYYNVFAKAIDGMFLPRCTAISLSGNTKAMSDLFIKIGRIQTHILSFIMCAYLIFGKSFMNLWAGPDYSESYYLSLLIMLPVTIPLIQSIGNTILQAYNKLKFQTIVYFFITILTITISLYLGKRIGPLGCAIALAISIILGEIIVMNIYYYKVIKLDIIKFWKEFFKITIPLIPIIILVKYLFNTESLNTWSSIIICGILFSLFYFIFTYFLLLNKQEKGYVTAFLLKQKK